MISSNHRASLFYKESLCRTLPILKVYMAKDGPQGQIVGSLEYSGQDKGESLSIDTASGHSSSSSAVGRRAVIRLIGGVGDRSMRSTAS